MVLEDREWPIFGVSGVVALVADSPELGLNPAEAALGPLGGDEGIDERELVGIGGLVVEKERGGEGFELGGVFAGDDVGEGVDAGFQGVERGGGLAFGSDGAGRFFGVQTIGVDLCFGCHKGNSVGGARQVKGVPCRVLLPAKHTSAPV